MPTPLVILLLGSLVGILISIWIDRKDPVLAFLMVVSVNLPGASFIAEEPSYGFFAIVPLVAAIIWRAIKKKQNGEQQTS